MSYLALKNRIIEARKDQPDALFIINLNNFKAIDTTAQALHRNLDYMPWSLNKLELLNKLADNAELSIFDRMEYYFPIIRFHSGWSEMEKYDFVHPILGFKGAYDYGPFLRMITDTSGKNRTYETTGELTEDRMQALEDLLNYCDEEQVKVLFVTVPQALEEKEYAQIDAAETMARERGYDCLNLLMSEEEMGIQPATDHQDYGHLNIHGAIRFTDYFSRYLVERYGFADKRGNGDYADWDEAAALYSDAISHDTLEFERELAPRDYNLTAPGLGKMGVSQQTIRFSWGETDGAEQYEIYRKSSADPVWALIDTVDHETTEYVQEDLEPGVTYTYTVVPVRSDGNGTLYGKFDYAGIQATIKEGK
jgi:hypothetical protein